MMTLYFNSHKIYSIILALPGKILGFPRNNIRLDRFVSLIKLFIFSDIFLNIFILLKYGITLKIYYRP